jgi:hypothetical protein
MTSALSRRPTEANTRDAATSDPFDKGSDRHWLWWADSRSLRPGLYLRRRRILRVSMWLLRPRYSWNVRGYGRRWT